MSKTAYITYAGRALCLVPAELGRQFDNRFTVTTSETLPPSPENNWKETRKSTDNPLTWEAPDQNGRNTWNTWSGYGYRIENELRQQGYEVVVVDILPCEIPEPDFTRLGEVSWRGSQMPVLSAILANRYGTIVCPTGWGKSFIIRLIARLYPTITICITVPSIAVADEFYKGLVVEFPTIGRIGDGKEHIGRITIAVTHSVHKVPEDTQLVLVDEAHAVLTAGFCSKLARFGRARFFAFTASPEGRGDGGDGFMEPMFGPVLVTVPYSEAVATGNVVPIIARIYDVPTGPCVEQMSMKHLRDKHGIWHNVSRNNLIAHLAAEIHQDDPEAQVLIMVDKTEHAYVLRRLLPFFTVVTGEVDDEREKELRALGLLGEEEITCTKRMANQYKEDFSSGELRYAIATSKWSKGVNFLDLAYLIRADGLATPIGATQISGRLSRKGSDGLKEVGILIDFNDRYSHDLASRSATRCEVYRQHGWTIDRRMGPPSIFIPPSNPPASLYGGSPR